MFELPNTYLKFDTKNAPYKTKARVFVTQTVSTNWAFAAKHGIPFLEYSQQSLDFFTNSVHNVLSKEKHTQKANI